MAKSIISETSRSTFISKLSVVIFVFAFANFFHKQFRDPENDFAGVNSGMPEDNNSAPEVPDVIFSSGNVQA